MSDPLHTLLCEKLGIEYPIVAFTHCKDVAVAVINAGGFAVLGEAMHPPEHIRADIRWIRERIGDKKFGIDLVLPASVEEERTVEELMAMIPKESRDFEQQIKAKYDVPDPKEAPDLYTWGGLDQARALAQLEVVFEENVPVFASGLGSPKFLLERAHAQGMMVWGLVGTPRQAQKQIDAGVDCIIAQGFDAAGHTGQIGTLSIVPQVVDLAEQRGIPVLAAGGITTGRHLAATLALGASGVWTGSLWLASRESDLNQPLKERLLECEATDTVYSNCISGYTMRTTRCPWHDEWLGPDAPPVLKAPLQMMLSSDYIQGSLDYQRKDLMTEAAGQGIHYVTEMKPARQILSDIVEEALDVFDRFASDDDD
ncbi:NAD(P)H-dependent flavin oxidoreductase [Pseudohalioglobus lutimaris]|uniref:Nitronate monooxygenase n=1 Tax=Pseudohalioglobus lutimaris TaxID=1737061 RepID=A0A2N5X3U5_9GAMM|nr:nitronate monooxygenase [Pseudohalioglobus lutimaris]PLW69161.1 nitronate monooxygenase [Pseudohalioglobus lutimaris]